MTSSMTDTRPAAAPPRLAARLTPNSAGMFYDVDAAVLATFGVTDDQYTLSVDDTGRLLVDIWVTPPVKSLQDLTRQFYQFWGQVSLERSEIVRTVGQACISFRFTTSSAQLAHRGVVAFRGEQIDRLLARLRTATDRRTPQLAK